MKTAAFLTGLAALYLFAPLCAAQFVESIPRPAKPIDDGKDTVSLVMIGDVMMHSRQLQYDHNGFLDGVETALREADIAVANLEFSLGGEPYTGYPAFSAPDSYARYLAEECGVDVFLTANNHVLDRRGRGLGRTLGVYAGLGDSLGVRYTGTALDAADRLRTNPLTVSRRGIRIALVNFTYGTNMGTDREWPKVSHMRKEEVSEAIEKAKADSADFIIALPHWGTEYRLRHGRDQESWAEWLVGQGVDAIIGTHPHVVQDTSSIQGRPVIYSIGNAISNMSAPNTRLGLAVTLRFVTDHAADVKYMLRPELEFIWCTLPGMLTDGYRTIFVKEWARRRGEWLTPYDFDNMIATLERVKAATGIVSD